jgi:hypothetical protein
MLHVKWNVVYNCSFKLFRTYVKCEHKSNRKLSHIHIQEDAGISGRISGNFIFIQILESILWYIEDQAFSPSYYLAPRPPLPPLQSACCLSFSVFLCVAFRAYCRERGKGGRSQIIRQRESLILYKSFNTLLFYLCSTNTLFKLIVNLQIFYISVTLCMCNISYFYKIGL